MHRKSLYSYVKQIQVLAAQRRFGQRRTVYTTVVP
jgi:hypothetical protein